MIVLQDVDITCLAFCHIFWRSMWHIFWHIFGRWGIKKKRRVRLSLKPLQPHAVCVLHWVYGGDEGKTIIKQEITARIEYIIRTFTIFWNRLCPRCTEIAWHSLVVLDRAASNNIFCIAIEHLTASNNIIQYRTIFVSPPKDMESYLQVVSFWGWWAASHCLDPQVPKDRTPRSCRQRLLPGWASGGWRGAISILKQLLVIGDYHIVSYYHTTVINCNIL